MKKASSLFLALGLLFTVGCAHNEVTKSNGAEMTRGEFTPSEPKFKGRLLSSWVMDLRAVSWHFGIPGVPEMGTPKAESMGQRATLAIRSIGTNGVPTLLQMLQGMHPKVKDGWSAWCADHAFGILRTNAQSAVPALLELSKSKNTEISGWAKSSLGKIRYGFEGPP